MHLKSEENFNRKSNKIQKILTAKNRNFCFRKEKNQMENDQLRQFVQQISREQEKKIAQEKRRNYFKEIGRKGGLKKKISNQFSKVISTRLTQKEFEKIEKKAKGFNLKLSEYTRLVLIETELKVNEFKTDEILLEYGNHFIRIKNLLRHREFSKLDHTKVILSKIEEVTKLIYDKKKKKMHANTKDNFQEDE